MSANKNTNINFRVSDKMKESLEKMASQEMRSLSSMIEVLITEAMEARKQKAKAK